MLKEQRERVEKAANNAVQIFADCGLTLDETQKAADRIKCMAQLQGEDTKINFECVQAAVRRDEGKLMEALKES